VGEEGEAVRCLRYDFPIASHIHPTSTDSSSHAEPATATVLGQVSNCNLEDFQKAIASADGAQQEFWESTTFAQRGAMLRKWYNLIMDNAEDSKDMLWVSAMANANPSF
jgi:acyl-CoA reductase-like NAD-dependent aldehyde dehydrogenase